MENLEELRVYKVNHDLNCSNCKEPLILSEEDKNNIILGQPYRIECPYCDSNFTAKIDLDSSKLVFKDNEDDTYL